MTRTLRTGHRPVRPIAVALALLGALVPSLALACARDGVPSVSANGRLAVVNRTRGQVVLTTWSPFVFSRAVQRGHVVALAENKAEIMRAHVLPHDAFARPWRWDFGDHTRDGSGTSVHHTYARPGTYRITVLFYYAPYAAWQPFDDVTIHVS